MAKTEKKPEPKKQEPPAEQQQGEQYHPMATPEPTTEDRLEALELKMKAVQEWTNKHQRYHFGGST